MLTEQLFTEFVKAASLAPSADNMQPWEFRKQENSIEAYVVPDRMLPTDVNAMFTWVSVGAAIQNIVEAATAKGLESDIEYKDPEAFDKPAAVVKLFQGSVDSHLAKWIPMRKTNRSNYETQPLDVSVISKLTESIQGLNAGMHWTTKKSDLDLMAGMDANSSFIRLQHKPLHDELFSILRFTQSQIETTRFGLDFASLEVPRFAVNFARLLQYWSVNRLVSRLGIGHLVAKKLASRLRKAGALCLITAKRRDPAGYMEAGRAMEQFWLTATGEGLSVHPYGVLPQYLTKVEVEPETFLSRYINIIKKHNKPFYSIFPGAVNEFPAIVLRVGRSDKQSARSNIRLRPEQIVRI